VLFLSMEFLQETNITEEERKTAFDYFVNHPACSHLYQKEKKESKTTGCGCTNCKCHK
jgi:hypothetical protein